jgi:RsmE family RNA methyltransferase
VETAALAADRIVLGGSEGRHASTVRRLAVGERADVTDGSGHLAECTVDIARQGELELAVIARQTVPPPEPRLVVLQAIPKGDRGELAVELLTEAGVDVIVPWAADRCVAVWRAERAARGLRRWAAAAQEAAKQSRRVWFPEVTGQAGLAEAVRLIRGAALAVVLDPDADRGSGGRYHARRGRGDAGRGSSRLGTRPNCAPCLNSRSRRSERSAERDGPLASPSRRIASRLRQQGAGDVSTGVAGGDVVGRLTDG